MSVPVVHSATDISDEPIHAILGRRVDEFACGIVNDEATLTVSSCTSATCEDAMVNRLHKFRGPLEDGIVSTSLNVGHCLAVTTDQLRIRDTHGIRTIPRENSPDLFDGYRDSLH